VTLSGALAFHTVATTLKDAVLGELTDAPDRGAVTVGELADDDCECGTLQVAIQRTFRSSSPPAEASGFTAGSAGAASPCPPPYVVADLAVRMVRCAPGPDERGNAPSVAALDTTAKLVETDAFQIEGAVLCALEELGDGLDGYLVSTQPRVGPAGGCVGSELHVSVWIVR
jgi:hypothetical protein